MVPAPRKQFGTIVRCLGAVNGKIRVSPPSWFTSLTSLTSLAPKQARSPRGALVGPRPQDFVRYHRGVSGMPCGHRPGRETWTGQIAICPVQFAALPASFFKWCHQSKIKNFQYFLYDFQLTVRHSKIPDFIKHSHSDESSKWNCEVF